MSSLGPWTIPDLPGEGTLGHFVAVLSSHTKLGVHRGSDKIQVDGWGSAHNLWKFKEQEDSP